MEALSLKFGDASLCELSFGIRNWFESGGGRRMMLAPMSEVQSTAIQLYTCLRRFSTAYRRYLEIPSHLTKNGRVDGRWGEVFCTYYWNYWNAE